MADKEDNKMAIPDYQKIMLPVLKFLADSKEHTVREVIEHISDEFKLTEEERRQLLPSGKQPIIDNRVGWARTYMKKAGLMENPKRGIAKITDRGLEILKQNPEKINSKYLEQFQEFIEFRTIKPEITDDPEVDIEGLSPTDLMNKGYNLVQASLAQDLLNKLRKEVHPKFFEQIVGRLLKKMGYGEYEETSYTNDGGIDGIIHQDQLGLEKIFFQAKKYDEGNNVTSSHLRDFVGTLDTKGVTKGVFITTSKFPKNPEEKIGKTPKSIIFIDGPKLAELMIQYNVGVSTEDTYEIKKIDEDFFTED